MNENWFRSPEAPSLPFQAEAEATESRRGGKELLAIARAQRWARVGMLAHFCAIYFHVGAGMKSFEFLPVTSSLAIPPGVIGAIPLAVLLYRRAPAGVLAGCAICLPVVALLALLWLDRRATHLLRQYGMRVGLAGADSEDLRRLRESFASSHNAR